MNAILFIRLFFLRFFRCSSHLKRQFNYKRGSLSHFAGNRNRASHFINHFFHNSHAKSGSMINTAGIRPFLCKRFKNMFQKFFAHTNSSIRNYPAIGNYIILFPYTFLFCQNFATRICKFNAISIYIQKYLSQIQRICYNVWMYKNTIS